MVLAGPRSFVNVIVGFQFTAAAMLVNGSSWDDFVFTIAVSLIQEVISISMLNQQIQLLGNYSWAPVKY